MKAIRVEVRKAVIDGVEPRYRNRCFGLFYKDELRAWCCVIIKNKIARLKELHTVDIHTGKGYASYLTEIFLMTARKRHCTHYIINGGDSNNTFFKMHGLKINKLTKL